MSFTINKQILLNAIVGLMVALSAFIFSLLIDPYYTGGDPSLYRKAYVELARLNLIDGYIYYSLILDSKEFAHFYLAWLASNLHIERDIFNGVSSAILAYVAMMLFHKRQASPFIAALIILTSFYFILLYTTTERLKIGMIFFCLSMLYINKPKRFYIFALLASISHIQIILLYLFMLFPYLANGFRKLLLSGKISKNLLLIIILISLPLVLVASQISSKFSSYYGIGDLNDLVRVFPFLFLSLWYSKNKTEVLHIFFPLIIAVLLLGYGRLNIFAYFIFLYYALPVNKGFNVGIILTTVYFLFSSIAFITRIIELGQPLLIQ